MTTPLTTAPTAKAVLPIGLLIAVLAMVAVLLLPLPADLPVAGHRMLAILAFAWWCGSARRCPTRPARS